jgi:Ribbon-helix-helix protein, copG family
MIEMKFKRRSLILITKAYKPITMNFPTALLAQVDAAAKMLGQTRSELIRKAVSRDLTYAVAMEIAARQDHSQKLQDQFDRWQQQALGKT